MGASKKKRKNYPQAKEFFTKAIAVLETAFENGHGSIDSASMRLGQIALEEKNYPEARKFLERAISSVEKRDSLESRELVQDDYLDSYVALLRAVKEEKQAKSIEKRIDRIRSIHHLDKTLDPPDIECEAPDAPPPDLPNQTPGSSPAQKPE